MMPQKTNANQIVPTNARRLLIVAVLLIAVSALGWHATTRANATSALPHRAQVIEPTLPPALPTITAQDALATLDRDLQASPWLRNADEFAAWADDTGDRCQVVTTATSEKLRELDYLLNEHWIGKRAVSVIALSASGLAAADPISGVGATAAGVVFVIRSSDEWTQALATQADELGEWIEEATQAWECYAEAYALAHESPSAQSIDAWIDAAQTLTPYLARGEQIVTQLNKLATDIDQRLSATRDYLDGIDHWSVDWLAENVNGHAINPTLAKLHELQPKLQMTQGRLMLDQSLIATLPMRFERVTIVD